MKDIQMLFHQKHGFSKGDTRDEFLKKTRVFNWHHTLFRRSILLGQPANDMHGCYHDRIACLLRRRSEGTRMTQEQMEERLKSAYTYENRAGHEKEHLEIEFVGRITRPHGRIVDLYVDSEHNYWFKEFRQAPDGRIITLEEAIFGRKIGKE